MPTTTITPRKREPKELPPLTPEQLAAIVNTKCPHCEVEPIGPPETYRLCQKCFNSRVRIMHEPRPATQPGSGPELEARIEALRQRARCGLELFPGPIPDAVHEALADWDYPTPPQPRTRSHKRNTAA